MADLHINRDGQDLGTYPLDEADALISDGRLAPSDLVWKEGMAGWLPASEVLVTKAWDANRSVPPPVPPKATPYKATPPLVYPTRTPPEGRTSEFQNTAGAPGPLPPKLHWGLVLLFTVLTLSIFMFVWVFIQSNWVKKIDPASNSTPQFIGYVVLMIAGQVLTEASTDGVQALGGLLLLGGYVAFYFGVYSMRRSMLNYYNKDNPERLKISAVWTFLFSILYLQSHMTEISDAASKS